jgi:hypothetical protein
MSKVIGEDMRAFESVRKRCASGHRCSLQRCSTSGMLAIKSGLSGSLEGWNCAERTGWRHATYYERHQSARDL